MHWQATVAPLRAAAPAHAEVLCYRRHPHDYGLRGRPVARVGFEVGSTLLLTAVGAEAAAERWCVTHVLSAPRRPTGVLVLERVPG